MFATTKTLCCYERGFELNFVVYKAAYKQVEVSMRKKEPKDSKFQEKTRKAKKVDLTIIQTLPGLRKQRS